MSDAPFMIGANGLIVDCSFNGLPQGQATVGLQPNIAPGESPNTGGSTPGPWVATQLLPGGVVQLVGGGAYVLPIGRNALQGIGSGSGPVLGGNMGAIQVDVVTGTAGTIQGLAFLSNAATPTAYIGINLDASNRPTFIVTDLSGVTKAVGAPSGAALPSGTPLSLRLFYDATGTVIPGYVAFLVNGVNQAVGTVTGPWSPFVPYSVLYGRGAVFSTYTAFVGRFNKLQAGNSAQPTNSQIAPSRTLP